MASSVESHNRGEHPPEEVGGPSLVYTRKGIPLSPETRREVDPETGEVRTFHQVKGDWRELPDHRQLRAERWALKSAAHLLLPADHRTTKCHKWRVPKQEIQVHRGGDHGRAFYKGLQVCASVWCCPVCASKISERRRVELAGAVVTAKAMGWKVYLLTLTVPHGLGDDVKVILAGMSAGWSKMNQGRQGVENRKLLSLRGTVRALEVTHGANGFHPHFHALLFLDTDLNPHQVQAVFSPLWQKVAVRSGLPRPSDLHGCQVDDGEKAAAYVSKGAGWGLESELTKGHLKHGKKGSRTPWDLLRDYSEGDRKAGALFSVYASAFHGRRQLYWSDGLKKLLAVQDCTDDELAHQEDEQAALLLARITDPQWKAVRSLHFESVVLDLAETSPDALRSFLEGLDTAREVLCL